METIGEWLAALGMSEYHDRFIENRIDVSVLQDLTDADLENLGVLLGDRRKMLRAIRGSGDGPLSKPTDAGISRRDSSERRQITVMFIDIVGSTELSATIDPEDLGTVLGLFKTRCAEAVAYYGGSIANYMGDGALAYFGYPAAHEDDAERAIRAGLSLIGAIGDLRLSIPTPLRVRVGIATGLVVVGDLIGTTGSRETVAVGETLNLAARIQAAASANSVVVGSLTKRLAGGAFDYIDLGTQQLKGIPTATRLWRVLGESQARGRFDARTSQGLTPFVGREEEIELLLRRWEQARVGEGQLVLLSAPPGFGKSRVTLAFRERLEAPNSTCVEYFGSPFHINSPFHPFIRQIEWSTGIVRADNPSEKLAKIEKTFGSGEPDISETTTLLATLLSIPSAERFPPLQIDEVVQKQRTMELLGRQLIRLAKQEPLLLVFEDAHWIDATSVETMSGIIRKLANLPVMIVVTYRPEFAPPWLDLGHTTMLRLNQLGRRQVSELIVKAARGKRLPDSIIEQILEKAQGVPLFVEEITRTILESGDLEEDVDSYILRQTTRDFLIPATLQDSLIARLDRLGSPKELILTASIIGREFSFELIDAVASVSQAELLADLRRLVRSDLLSEQGTPPHSRYAFKHALIRDAAFQSVLKARKRELHSRIANVLADRFSEVVAAEPEVIAHHFTEAQIIDRALEFWRHAANRATSRLAYVEALGHVTKALSLIETLPSGHGRDEWELAFLVIEGPSRMALDGWDSPEAKDLYEKARIVAERLGRPAEVFRSVWGLWMGAHSGGQHKRAHDLFLEIQSLMENTNEPEHVVQAHHAGGSQMVAEGAPRTALFHIDKLLTNYRMDVHGNHALMYGAHDPGCCSLGMKALSLTMLGYPDLAEEESLKSLAMSERLGHQPSISHTHMFRAEHCIIMNRFDDAAPHLSASIELANKYSLAGYLISDNLMLGLVLVMQGEFDAGVRQAEIALDDLRKIPTRRFHLPIRISIVGRAKNAAGDHEGALALFNTALEAAANTGETWYEPELLRLKADCLIARSHKTEIAEECLNKAIGIAKRQDAKFWELRSANSLARLCARKGQREQALRLLSPIYEWFTEGFEGEDLIEAKKLIEELSS
jgi:class 3 adenylate cyclase/tetratricopeptide (TPR) repeat protein